jgi:hypothetical protein
MRTPTKPVPAVTTEGSDDTALHQQPPDDTTKKQMQREIDADVYEVHEGYVRSRFNPNPGSYEM